MCRRCGGQCVTMEIRSASERRAQLEIVVMTATVTMDGRMLGAWWRWNSCSVRPDHRPWRTFTAWRRLYIIMTTTHNKKAERKKRSPRKKWFLISNVIIRTFSHFSMNRKFHLALNNNWSAQAHTHRLTNCGTCRCVPFLFWQNVIIIIVRCSAAIYGFNYAFRVENNTRNIFSFGLIGCLLFVRHHHHHQHQQQRLRNDCFVRTPIQWLFNYISI